MIYCPIYQVRENLNRSHTRSSHLPPTESARCSRKESGLRAAWSSPAARFGVGARFAPSPPAHRAGAAGFALPLPFPSLRSGRSAPPNRRVFAINRYAHKTGVLYNRWRALACRRKVRALAITSRLRYKTAVLCNRRASNVVRAASRSLYSPPAKRGFAPPRGRAHAFGANVARLRRQKRNGRPGGLESRAGSAQVFSFPQLFQHPPAPLSAGSTDTR